MVSSSPTFDDVAARGRLLMSNLDAKVFRDPPFLLACECDGRPLDLAIKRVSLFAFVLSAIIGTIVALRAAPLPIASIAVFWFAAASAARLFARRRRREHGAFVIDFEHDVVHVRGAAGDSAAIAVASGASIAIQSSPDPAAPYWLVFRPSAGRAFRIARGTAAELTGVLRVFREYNVEVKGELAPEEDADGQ